MTETWLELSRRIAAEEHAQEALSRSELTGRVASFVLWDTVLGTDLEVHYVKLTVRVDARYPYTAGGGHA